MSINWNKKWIFLRSTGAQSTFLLIFPWQWWRRVGPCSCSEHYRVVLSCNHNDLSELTILNCLYILVKFGFTVKSTLKSYLGFEISDDYRWPLISLSSAWYEIYEAVRTEYLMYNFSYNATEIILVWSARVTSPGQNLQTVWRTTLRYIWLKHTIT